MQAIRYITGHGSDESLWEASESFNVGDQKWVVTPTRTGKGYVAWWTDCQHWVWCPSRVGALMVHLQCIEGKINEYKAVRDGVSRAIRKAEEG